MLLVFYAAVLRDIAAGRHPVFSTWRDLLPHYSSGVDLELLPVCRSFFYQGFLKQLLTEGERCARYRH